MKPSDFKIKTKANNDCVGGFHAIIMSESHDIFELVGEPHTKHFFEKRSIAMAAAHSRIGEIIEEHEDKHR